MPYIREKNDENNLTLKKAIGNILIEMNKKFNEYKIILRDGPDTSNRDFDFIKQSTIKCSATEIIKYIVVMNIKRDLSSELKITACLSGDDTANKFGTGWLKEIFGEDKNVICEEIIQ